MKITLYFLKASRDITTMAGVTKGKDNCKICLMVMNWVHTINTWNFRFTSLTPSSDANHCHVMFDFTVVLP